MLLQQPGKAELLAFMGLAAGIDVLVHKIPNWLIGGGLLLAAGSASIGLPDTYLLGQCAYGLLFGFGLLMPFYVLGISGAGDVKMVAVCGAFLGPYDLLPAMFATFLVAGVFALALAVRRKVVVTLLSNVGTISTSILPGWASGIRAPKGFDTARSVGRLPYAVCVLVGTSGFLVSRQLGWL